MRACSREVSLGSGKVPRALGHLCGHTDNLDDGVQVQLEGDRGMRRGPDLWPGDRVWAESCPETAIIVGGLGKKIRFQV